MAPLLTYPVALVVQKRALVFFCLFLSVFSVYSQKDLLPQADKLFNEKRYGEAIPLYDKIYEKKKDRAILLKIADANFLNENYAPAQKYYAEYFRDSVYENIPQFTNYAKSSRMVGKIALSVKLYQKIYDVLQDQSAKDIYETYKFYLDNSSLTRSYNLDSNYKCVVIDAGESLDTMAVPMFYNWEFDDGKSAQGLKVEHCFESTGTHSAILNITDQKTGMVKHRDTMIVLEVLSLPVQFSSPKAGKRYFYVDFDATNTLLPGYEIIDYLWDMDDGEIASGKKIKYKYNNARDYWVKLIVLAKNKTTGEKELFSANRKIEILENYETPNKKFQDALNGSK